MRVLLTGTEGCGIDEAERLLRAAGHEVVSCVDDPAGAASCNALAGPGRCTADTSIDLIVVARKRPVAHVIRREQLALCALLSHVPLVVVGSTACNPFGERAAACIEGIGAVVEACELASATPAQRVAAGAVHAAA